MSGVWGEHLSAYVPWATDLAGMRAEIVDLAETLTEMAWHHDRPGMTLTASHWGQCSRFLIAQYDRQRWYLNLAPIGDPPCDPLVFEAEAWLTAGGWSAPVAHCDECRQIADGAACGYWRADHLLGVDGSCRPYHHLDLPPGTSTDEAVGRLVDAFVYCYGADEPAQVFMDSCLWPRRPRGVATDVDLDVLRRFRQEREPEGPTW